MLRPITTDLWALEDEVRLPAGLRLPARATVLRLSGGALVLHSPLAIDDEDARAIDELGEVSFIIAPSSLHHMYAAKAAGRWPSARVLGAPALEKKLGVLAFERLPASSREAADLFAGELLVRRIDGVPSLDEHVFFHPRSRTLIVTDLVFNVHACPGFGMPVVLRLTGAWKRLAQSLEWRLATKDRTAASASVADVLAWDIDRLVMAHGDVIDSGAHEPLADALRWMRGAALVSAA